MAVFNYTARDAGGAVTEGTIDSQTRRDALRKLQARGLKPVKVEEAGAAVRAKEAVADVQQPEAGRHRQALFEQVNAHVAVQISPRPPA